MASTPLAILGAVLVLFGAIGVRSAEGIVETQRREGMAAFADAPIDEATRVRVTRYVAGVCLVVGAALLAVGLGVV